MSSNQAQENLEVSESLHKGAILKKARESQGISLESVHEATKIPMDALRAIEENYKIKILTEFYYNSFLKIYAKYLGLDVAQFLDQNKKVIKARPMESDYELNFNLLETINRKLTKERKRQIVMVLAGLFCCWLVFKLAFMLVHRKPKDPNTAKAVKTQAMKKTEPAKEAPQKIESPIKSGQVEQAIPVMPKAIPAPMMDPAAPNNTKSIVLTVRAKKESWLRVKTDGNVVYQSTLNVGDVETWEANEEIEITGRNISELEFEHNGKMIGSLGKAGRRAKGLIVTKDGLSVTK